MNGRGLPFVEINFRRSQPSRVQPPTSHVSSDVRDMREQAKRKVNKVIHETGVFVFVTRALTRHTAKHGY